MADSATLRLRYQSLFFIGIATIIVLLPFPSVLGILLDASVLALAYPLIGRKASLILVIFYNFNPLKLNGALMLYYVFSAVLNSRLPSIAFLDRTFAIGIVVAGLMVAVTLAEYFFIKLASRSIWGLLSTRDRRIKSMLNVA